MNAPAKRAQFDGSSQHRRSMLAKVHIAKKQLVLSDDDYQQILLDETGKMSAGDCNEQQLDKVLARLQRQGFKPLPKKGTAQAQHPMAKKARAMWISLYQLGVVRNSSEDALEAFATRQLGCEKLVWARQSQANRLIEALKAMAERAGWRQRADDGSQLTPQKLRLGLCECILHRLKEVQLVPHDWTLEQAAFRLCGMDVAHEAGGYPAEQLNRVADALGAKLRIAAPMAETAQDDAA